MIRTVYALSNLLGGIAIFLMGLGLLGTALGIRGISLGFSDTVIGLIMSSYFGGFIAGSYYGPRVIRSFGPIRAYAVFAAVASACAFTHAMLTSPWVWMVLRFAVGFCVVCLYIVLESWLNHIAPSPQRGRIFAIYMMVTLAALACGQFLWLLDPAAGASAFGLAAAFFSMGLVPVALTRIPEPQPVAEPKLHLRTLVQLAPVSVAAAMAGALTTSGFWALAAVYAKHIGFIPREIAWFIVLTIAGGVLIQWPVGRLSDKCDRRFVLAAVAILAMMAAFLAAWSSAKSSLLLFGSVFILGGLTFPIYAIGVAYLNDRIKKEDVLDASRGILLIYGAGALIGPFATGLLMHTYGNTWYFYTQACVLAVFAVYTLLRIRVRDAVPIQERSTYVPMTRTSQAALEMDPRIKPDTLKHNE